MTSRERVTAAIEFNGPDRIPFTHVLFPGALWNHGQRLMDLLDQYRDDFGNNTFKIEPEPSDKIEEYVDDWGVTWHRLKGYTAGEVKKPALEKWDAWDKYQFPTEPAAHYVDLESP